MALLGFEHFDLYSAGQGQILQRGYVASSDGGVDRTPGRARNGTGCYSFNQFVNAQSLVLGFPVPRNVLGHGIALSVPTNVSANTPEALGIELRYGSESLRAIVGPSGSINLYQNTTLRASSAGNLWAAGTYFHIEMKGDSAAGTVEVRLNGNSTPVIMATGLTFGLLTGIAIGRRGGAGGAFGTYDDWVWWDDTGSDITDFVGDTFVLVSPPVSDGAVSDWTATPAGPKFEVIDEALPNDADYIEATAIGQAAEFNHSALNLGVGSIVAIASQTRAFKAEAGAASYSTGLASGNTTAMSPEIALATGTNIHTHIVPRNPENNQPWTQQAANAARLRVERNA